MKDRSQFGEYRSFLAPALEKIGTTDRVVVDVGAGPPGSSSFNLVTLHGFRGLLVDAFDTESLKALFRPHLDRVTIEKVAIACEGGPQVLYLHDKPAFHSVLKDWDLPSKTPQFMTVQALTLVGLLEEYDIKPNFDVLVMAAAGLDLALVEELLASTYRPRILMFRYSMQPHTHLLQVKAELEAAGYVKEFQNHASLGYVRA